MVSSKKVTVDAADNKTAVKAAAPVVDKKVPEIKAEVKAEAKPEETKKAEEKKEEVKKPEARKAAKKAEPKKTAEPKKAAEPKTKKAPAEKTVKSALYVQYAGKEYTEKELLEAVEKAYTKLGNKAADMKSVEIYLKPEENVAYYVINGHVSDEYKIEL